MAESLSPTQDEVWLAKKEDLVGAYDSVDRQPSESREQPPPPPPELTDIDNKVMQLMASGEWRQVTDTSGRAYFYHVPTKRTTWSLHAEVARNNNTLGEREVPGESTRGSSNVAALVKVFEADQNNKPGTPKRAVPTTSSASPEIVRSAKKEAEENRRKAGSFRASTITSPRLGPTSPRGNEEQRLRLAEAKKRRSETRPRCPSIEELSTKAETIQRASQKFDDDHLANDTPRHWRQRIIELYKRYNPSKLLSADALLVKYKGREQELHDLIVQKYAVSPVTDTQVGSEEQADEQVVPPVPIRVQQPELRARPVRKERVTPIPAAVKSRVRSPSAAGARKSVTICDPKRITEPSSPMTARRELAERKAAALMGNADTWTAEVSRRKAEELALREEIKAQREAHRQKLEKEKDIRRLQLERIRSKELEFRAKLQQQRDADIMTKASQPPRPFQRASSRSSSVPSASGGRNAPTVTPFNPAQPFDTRSPLVSNGWRVENSIVHASEHDTPRASKRLSAEEQRESSARLQRHHSTAETRHLYSSTS